MNHPRAVRRRASASVFRIFARNPQRWRRAFSASLLLVLFFCGASGGDPVPFTRDSSIALCERRDFDGAQKKHDFVGAAAFRGRAVRVENPGLETKTLSEDVPQLA